MVIFWACVFGDIRLDKIGTHFPIGIQGDPPVLFGLRGEGNNATEGMNLTWKPLERGKWQISLRKNLFENCKTYFLYFSGIVIFLKLR